MNPALTVPLVTIMLDFLRIPLVLASLASTSAALSQDPAITGDSLESIRARLRSEDLATVAWGGWIVARDQVQAAEGDVVAALSRLRDLASNSTRRLTSHALFDALVRLDAELPAADLVPYRKEAPVQTLVLLAKRPAANCGLLLREFEAVDDGRGSSTWNALGNLLTVQRPQEFVELVVRRLRVQLEVFVVDDPSFFGSSSSISMGSGCGGKAVPDEFPPVAIYSLTRGTGTVFAPGRYPVGFRRQIYRRKEFGLGGTSVRIDADTTRFGWAADLLGTDPDALPIHQSEPESISFTTNAKLQTDVLEMEQNIRRGYRELCESFVRAELMTKAKSSDLRLEIDLEVEDLRTEPASALPAIVLAGPQR